MNTIQKTYTKQDIVKRVAALTQTDRKTTAIFVNYVFTALRDIMTSNDPSLRIEVRDFGILEVKPTKSKPKARNPKSGEIIYIPARRKTHFKPGKILKRFLSQPFSTDPAI